MGRKLEIIKEVIAESYIGEARKPDTLEKAERNFQIASRNYDTFHHPDMQFTGADRRIATQRLAKAFGRLNKMKAALEGSS